LLRKSRGTNQKLSHTDIIYSVKKFWPYWKPVAALVFVNFFVWSFVLKETKEEKQPSQAIITAEPTTTNAPIPKEITIAAVGDISLSREVNWQIQQRNDPTFPFQKTVEFLKKVDLTIGNLEGPLIKDCPLARTGMKFCGNVENAKGLALAGFDLLNLANNHIANFGSDGIRQTIETLKEHQIGYFGLEKVSYKTINGSRIALLGFDDIVRRIDESNLIGKIKKAKRESGLVIVNLHWGVEYQKKPTERQKYLARLAIDSGANLIIGHHPHVLQPIEYYKDKPILYSLGNFVFDQMWSQETRTGAIALITINNHQISKVDLIPVFMRECCQPQIDESIKL